jgi:hypothetical protein
MSGPDLPSPLEPPILTDSGWSRRKVRWLCTGMGAWGVATGFAVFILLWTHGRSHPFFFLFSLLVAALIAYVAELLRDLIKEGVSIPAITGPRVVVTMLLLTIIELVVHAGTEIVQLSGDVSEAASTQSELRSILAPLVGADSGAMTDAIGLAVAWVLVGAILARRLSRIVFLQLRGDRQGLLRGAREGVLGALVAAPVCAVGCLLIGRGFSLVKDLVVRGDAAAQDLRLSLGHLSLDPLWVIALKLPAYLWLGVYYLSGLARGAGRVGLILGAGFALFWAWRHRGLLWVRIAAVAVPVIVLAPLPVDPSSIAQVALLAIVVWVVPGFILGVATPLLRGAGDEPRLWGLIAFVAAVLLSVLTLLKFTNPWCYALAFGLVLIGLLFFRGASLREYWPLAAAAMASMVSGVMVIVEKATFLGVVSEAHDIYRLPLVRSDSLFASMKALRDSIGDEHIFDTADTRALARRVQDLANLSAGRQVARLDEIKSLIAQIELWTRQAQSSYWQEIADHGNAAFPVQDLDIAVFYHGLAQLALNPPDRGSREAAYNRLLAPLDELIRAETESDADSWRFRAQVTDNLDVMEKMVRIPNASEDAVRFGPTLAKLAAQIYQFSTEQPAVRGQQGSSLLSRLEALMRDQEMVVPGDGSDHPTPYHLPSYVPGPLERRLDQLWKQLTQELGSPGTGGIGRPMIYRGDRTHLYWQDPQILNPMGDESTGRPRTRLENLQLVKGEIQGQRAALALEQEARPKPTLGKEEGQAPGIDAGDKKEGQQQTVHSEELSEDSVMAHAAPSGARFVRLIEIRRKLAAVQASAVGIKQAWTAPPAVTLELSLVGSFGFWVTVGLLAAWSLTEVRKHGAGEA